MLRYSNTNVLHDDNYSLSDSLQAFQGRAPSFVFGKVGDWQRTVEVAESAGATVVVGEWHGEIEHRIAAGEHLLSLGFTYNLAGEQAAIQDARGNRTSFAYDAAGRLVSQVNAVGNVTSYNYDNAGRNTSVVDAKGNTKTLTYDAVSRLTEMQYADGTRTTLAYDAVGRRTTMVDSGGTTSYVYDARGSLTGTTVLNSRKSNVQYFSAR